MSWSLGEAEFYLSALGCAADSLAMNCWKEMQSEHKNVHIDCQRIDEVVQEEEW